uniref:Uracil-DNA glycosylase-like domain-containing protein n=1 Tax=Paulinella chromatophora TaxID=39717 RepID=B1X5N0_PAUCH|nr:hypothetical protein PCC_0839 [Paulinella chromatophora]ACB43249.1 hypothetical protein PCC_0839 [Paulinella chromatophora]
MKKTSLQNKFLSFEPHKLKRCLPESKIQKFQKLSTAYSQCHKYSISNTGLNVVISRGNPYANLMIIEETTKDENYDGIGPFAGKAGQLLDRMLSSIGIHANKDAFMCNATKSRSQNNIKLTSREIVNYRQWLEHQTDIIKPRIILLAGATAVEGVLNIKGGIQRIRGYWYLWEGYWLMPILHPSYLLRNSSTTKNSPNWLMWRDLQNVKCRLKQLKVET